jgi:hypothetical protein
MFCRLLEFYLVSSNNPGCKIRIVSILCSMKREQRQRETPSCVWERRTPYLKGTEVGFAGMPG